MTEFAIVDDKIPVTTVFTGFQSELQVRESYRACYCCAFECELELTVEVMFCGMTATATLQIPGVEPLGQGLASLPDGSYLILSAQISCTPCGWDVLIGVCGYCESTQEASSDAFTAVIPFAATQAPSGGYCPAPGQVELECFGEQFGIPCVTTTTAEIA